MWKCQIKGRRNTLGFLRWLNLLPTSSKETQTILDFTSLGAFSVHGMVVLLSFHDISLPWNTMYSLSCKSMN